MRKLGKRQLQILQVMAERNEEFDDETTTIHTKGGLYFHCFFSSHIGDEINKILTLDRIIVLHDRGLLENITEEGWRWRGSQYRITEKGLALIREANECLHHTTD